MACGVLGPTARGLYSVVVTLQQLRGVPWSVPVSLESAWGVGGAAFPTKRLPALCFHLQL